MPSDIAKSVGEELEKGFIEIIRDGFELYADFIFGLLVGLVLFFLYDRIIGSRKLRSGHKRDIQRLEESNKILKVVVSEKLEKLEANDGEGKKVLKAIRRYFNKI